MKSSPLATPRGPQSPLEPPAQLVAVKRQLAAELEATGKFLRPHAMQWPVSECGPPSGLGLFTCDHTGGLSVHQTPVWRNCRLPELLESKAVSIVPRAPPGSVRQGDGRRLTGVIVSRGPNIRLGQ
jgi:hypothetical protein